MTQCGRHSVEWLLVLHGTMATKAPVYHCKRLMVVRACIGESVRTIPHHHGPTVPEIWKFMPNSSVYMSNSSGGRP